MNPSNISRFKKERHLKSLSEDDFRDSVVRPLFLRSGYKDGRDLCGPFEHGKDAIFVEMDGLGLPTVSAVQTKKGSLNLASKASANLIEATTQLRTALASSVIFLDSKQKCRPNKAILCASGKINDAAREHILNEITNPNIQFLDMDDLIPRIDELYPELWLGIDADIVPYFRAIEEIANGPSSNVDDPYEGVLTSAASDEQFITLSLFRTTTKTFRRNGKVESKPEIEELPLASIVNKKNRRILITGEGGSGKSTGLLRIALEFARKGLLEDVKYTVPMLLRAPEIVRQKPSELISFFDFWSRHVSGAKKAAFTVRDLEDGKVAVLIDALDELASDDERKYIFELLADLYSKYPKCQQIVASRPMRPLADGTNLKMGFDEYRISPISWKQASKIVKAVTAQKKIPQEQSQEFLRRLEKLHGFELNPLLVTVFAATTDYTKQDIPANITELFKKFTELMLGRWDERKGLKHQYQAPLKDFVLTKIAFQLHSLRSTRISRLDAEAIATAELEKRGHSADVELMLTEIFDRSGLFRIADGHIEFRHHLLQEFFAGRAIPSSKFIEEILPDEWWRRALVFYFGEHPEAVDQLTAAMDGASELDALELFEAAATVGLALQACYLSPVTEKIELWKKVATAFSITQESLVRASDAAVKYPLSHFFHLYLYARDSVALSHLRQSAKLLVDWADKSDLHDNATICERVKFWLIVGLIESGDIDEADKVIRVSKLTNGEHLMAIFLGCRLAQDIRPVSAKERNRAAEICARLESKVTPLRQVLVKEFGSMLLEWKDGGVVADLQ